MLQQYEPKELENRWQRVWEERSTFKARKDDPRPKYYVLEMFPYPSGRIHMGHVRNYAIGDAIARYYKKRGFKLFHPMGWDAFGLPAENAAIERGIHPADWTYKNIREMRSQLKSLGLAYDWDREIATCHPGYYRWEQLVFTRALERDLAYRKSSLVNWSEKMQTVLANEQVIDGRDYRYGLPVVQKELTQWFFRTTAYCEELLQGLTELEGSWPERVIAEQRARIGKSYGSEVIFRLEKAVDGQIDLPVFTTRPDTLFGVTFMSLAPEHPLSLKLASGTDREREVRDFVDKAMNEEKQSRSASEGEKNGVFTGRYCINPINGDRVPIFVANFVLMEYGTGAVMSVPAHDQRDFEFAKKYDLPIKVVIQPSGSRLDPATMNEAYAEDGIQVNSGRFDGVPNRDAIDRISDYLSEIGSGGKTVSFRLRDWCISRQRYWGAPIPVVHCERCGIVPVPEKDLPVLLPENVSFQHEGGSPLRRCEEFVSTSCPTCGFASRRETDTFDTFVESSWYFLRYTSPRLETDMLDADEVKAWLPIDQYIGGIEHAVGHLVYARFYHKMLRDLGFVPKDAPNEPFLRLLTQGMVCKETQYTVDDKGQPEWHYPQEAKDGVSAVNGKPIHTGRIEKMSKSKRNIVDPNDIIARYGADSARLFALFASPPENDLVWKDEGVDGVHRFLGRLWRLVRDRQDSIRSAAPFSGDDGVLEAEAKELRRMTHKIVSSVTDDIEKRFHFNTAIAKCMELTNALIKLSPLPGNAAAASVQRDAVFAITGLLSPFAPHFAEEIWSEIGGDGLAADAPWPLWDEKVASDEVVTVAVQVCGKLRAKIDVPAGADRDETERYALSHDNVKRHIEGKKLEKVIVIPGKLVNIVAK